MTLESTLSTHSYNVTREEETVPGDRDSHVTLTFSAEVRPSHSETHSVAGWYILQATEFVHAAVVCTLQVPTELCNVWFSYTAGS